MSLWKLGDEETLKAYMAASQQIVNDEYRDILEEYNNALITKRNEAMTKYAEEALLSGKEVFICVGSAHVVGDGDMAENLKKMGYTVEVVTNITTGEE